MRKITFLLGILSPIAFVLLSGAAQSLTPGFNGMSSPASNLATTSPYGWLQALAFLVGGVGFTLIGISVFQNVRRRTQAAPSLIVLFGIILVLEALFQSNPTQNDSATNIHIGLFVIGIIGMVISTFLFGVKLPKGIMSVYSYLTGLVALIGFIGIFATQGQVGMWQMIATGPLFLWLIVLDIYAFVKYKTLSA